MSQRLIDLEAVLRLVPLSKTQLYRLRNEGSFPSPISIGLQRVAWIEEEVNAWIEQRIKMRDEGFGAEKRRARALHAVGGRR